MDNQQIVAMRKKLHRWAKINVILAIILLAWVIVALVVEAVRVYQCNNYSPGVCYYDSHTIAVTALTATALPVANPLQKLLYLLYGDTNATVHRVIALTFLCSVVISLAIIVAIVNNIIHAYHAKKYYDGCLELEMLANKVFITSLLLPGVILLIVGLCLPFV